MKLTVERLIKIELLLSILIVIFTIMERSMWVSLCFAASFLVLLLAVALMTPVKNKHTLLLVATVLTAAFMVAISAFHTGRSISLSSLNFFCVFIALLLYLYLMQLVEAGKDLCDFLMAAGLVLAAVYPVAYFVFDINSGDDLLTLNFTNPNLLGMWILQAVSFGIVGALYYRNWLMKAISLLLTACNFFLLMQTGARNAMMALALGGLVLLLLCRKKPTGKWLFGLVAAFPLIFLAVYLGMDSLWAEGSLVDKLFSEAGKEVSSRYDVWISSLYHVQNYWLTGSYFKLAGNMHNSHLVMLCSYGAVVLVLTMVYLFKIMQTVNQNCNTVYQKVCLVVFCVTIFMGNAEGALFSGAVGLYIPACTFLLLARYDRKEPEKTSRRIVLTWGSSSKREGQL